MVKRTRRVGIVGAGVSGLLACKYVLQEAANAGWEVTVLEARECVGGVWSSSYSTARLQTSKQQYEISDFPWPEEVQEQNPWQEQVQGYLYSYARAFKLLPHIRFGSSVQAIAAWRDPEVEDTGVGWQVRLADGQLLHFHFLFLCCGLFGDLPRPLPILAAQAEAASQFAGKVLHALDYCRLDEAGVRALVAGQRVVVLGFQKTAIDVALEVAAANPTLGCTLLFRRAHWLCPPNKLVLGLLPLGHLFSTRFAQFWVRQPGQGILQSALQHMCAPLRWLVFRVAEWGLLLHYPTGKGKDQCSYRKLLRPEHPLLEDLAGCILPQLPPTFFTSLEKGAIRPIKAASWTLSATGITLSDPHSTHLETDVLIMCTGYDGVGKLRALLPQPYRDRLTGSDNLLPLYRGLIHPDIPAMAFLGYQEGLSTVHSSELGARWLAHLLAGKLACPLPSKTAMDTEIRGWTACVSAATRFLSRLCISILHIKHADELCRDMGWSARRKLSAWADFFSPYSNADYRAPNPSSSSPPSSRTNMLPSLP